MKKFRKSFVDLTPKGRLKNRKQNCFLHNHGHLGPHAVGRDNNTEQNILWRAIDDFADLAKKLDAKLDKVIDFLEIRQEQPHPVYDHDFIITTKFPMKETDDFMELNNKIVESPGFRQKLVSRRNIIY